jgi:chemotaxis protein CheZ
MSTTVASKSFLEPIELGGFKAKANLLMQLLQTNDLEGALRCINEINLINNQHVHEVLGKITRGLHNAISDLNISTANEQSTKNKTRAGLSYVLEVTSNAAQKALDMTEQTQTQVQAISSGQDELNVLLKSLQATSLNASQQKMLSQLGAIVATNSVALQQIGKNNTEIVLAQNFQDLTSQSITKAIRIISDVENSLIALTQHTNLLKQLSLISTSPDLLEIHVSEELKQNLNKIESPPTPAESEHLDQDEVDNLLSSLGF